MNVQMRVHHWAEYNWNATSNRKFEAKLEGQPQSFTHAKSTNPSTSDGRYQLFWFRYDTSPIPWILVDTDTKIDTDTHFFPFIKITV
jgi:hypothetical protein